MLALKNLFRNPNIATRLLFWFGLVGLLPLTLVTFVSYYFASQSLTQQLTQSLDTLAEDKAQQIELYASERQKDATILSRQPIVAAALENFTWAFKSGGIDSDGYVAFDEEFRPYLIDYTQSYGYEDLFLISHEGDAVFSVKRGEDLGSNYYSGIYRETELAKVFGQTQTLLSADFSDFDYYPATNEPAAFIAAPVFKDGELIGAVALQINNSILYDTVNDYTGLGLTGEVVIAANKSADKILYVTPLRNDPYAAFRRSVIVGSNVGLPIQAAMKGIKSSGISDDYRGEEVIASWRYLPGLRWGMVVKIDTDEALAPVTSLRNTAIALGSASLLVVLFIAVLVSRSISRPIVNLTQVAGMVSGGDINAQAKVETRDEIGTLAAAFNTMTSRLRDFIATLEQRVADRTKALATSTDVSRRLSTILDRKELVAEVVNQVNESFGYYHTQIYFYDETGENMVMAGGTGQAGKLMLEQFHKVVKGRGLVGRAAESGQPMLVSDTSQNPEWLPNPLLPDTRAEMAIPISIGDQVLGVLDVQHNVKEGLKQEDVDSLQSIANQVAVAMQNIRQYENTRKIAADMGVVATVGIATSTITESGQLLQEVVDLSKQSFDLYHAHIYLMNDAENVLTLTAGAGEVGRQMVSEKRSIPLESEQSLVARAARTREGVVVNDVTTAPDFLPNPLLPDTRSEMAVPMIVAGKVIGVLDVQSETANRFTNVDVSIKTTLASQVAVALQNARTFSQSKQQAERESAVNLITQRIQNTTSVEAALKIAARELGHALGMKSTLVKVESQALADSAQKSGTAPQVPANDSETMGTGVLQ